MLKIIQHLLKYLFLFIIGGLIYYTIEILYRGYSHISMFFVGGICFILCGLINELLTWDMPLYQQMFICMVLITIVEFIAGYILNIKMGLNIWDYSNLKFNIMGQVSLLFAWAWFFLSLPAIVLDDYLRYFFFHEEKPRYKLI